MGGYRLLLNGHGCCCDGHHAADNDHDDDDDDEAQVHDRYRMGLGHGVVSGIPPTPQTPNHKTNQVVRNLISRPSVSAEITIKELCIQKTSGVKGTQSVTHQHFTDTGQCYKQCHYSKLCSIRDAGTVVCCYRRPKVL